MRSYGETNPGRKRRRNEDAFVCEPPLFAVADGMGGAQAGEVASSLAAATLSGALGGNDRVAAADAEQIVRRLISEANTLVHERATNDATASGMGTTMTVAIAGSDDIVTIGHVGDSRAYLLRDGSLEQITDDHSLVAELVRRGELSPAEAEVHPQRSVITRALGTDPEVEIDVFSIKGQNGDVFLLCSDGLSTMVDAEAMGRILERNRGNLEAATHELIKTANDAGGDDNITAVLFALTEPSTVETQVVPAVGEEDDTLHPEDGVPAITLPLETEAPLVEGDTMVVSAEEVGAAVAAEPEPVPYPFGRLVLATFVIIGLSALIVVLAIWGLAR